jgi:hypothetical protein
MINGEILDEESASAHSQQKTGDCLALSAKAKFEK